MPNTVASRSLRIISLIGALASAVAIAACSDTQSTAPVVAPSVVAPFTGAPRNGGYTVTADGATSVPVTKTALLWNKRLSKAVTRSITVDSATGGTLLVASLGFTLVVPPRAIPTRSMTITVRAMAGNAVAYEFSPVGAQFAVPLIMKQDLGLTSWSSNRTFKLFSIGYFKDASQVDAEGGTAVVDETLPALLAGSFVLWSARHFSGYMVSVD